MEVKNRFFSAEASSPDSLVPPPKILTRRSLTILRFLVEQGEPYSGYIFHMKQDDLAAKLDVTRQALGVHLRKLRKTGIIEVGRGFVNVTNEGRMALGVNTNPAIITVRIKPEKLSKAVHTIKGLHALEIFRVAGESDFVLIVEQHALERVLSELSAIDGILETKSMISIEKLKP
jgi:DNA-binding Lrp family transcriptional regulator